eukprot:GHVL01014575.1.p1 GENE.GHVL01014575.1~~GHVL01014575.1.p1  ORF type:complete len:240 (-),score=42.92 GHVL01014575.1:539-1213(-)
MNVRYSKTYLLLTNIQNALINGTVFDMFEVEETEPFQSSIDSICSFFKKYPYIKHRTLMVNHLSENYEDNAVPDELYKILRNKNKYFRRTGKHLLSSAPKFATWLDECVKNGDISTLVIGGWTETTQVKGAAVEIQERYEGEDLNIVVDLNLTAARASQYVNDAHKQAHLHYEFGSARCHGTSAVKLTRDFLKRLDIEVVSDFDWKSVNDALSNEYLGRKHKIC